MEEIGKLLADKIKEVREERNLTQREVSEFLGYKTSNAISELERGKVQVSAIDLWKLADLTNKPIAFFYGEEYDDPQTSDLLALVQQLSPEEKAGLVQVAGSMSQMKLLGQRFSEAEKTGEFEKSEEARIAFLEQIYQVLISQSLPLAAQLRQLNVVKDQIEIDLGIKERPSE